MRRSPARHLRRNDAALKVNGSAEMTSRHWCECVALSDVTLRADLCIDDGQFRVNVHIDVDVCHRTCGRRAG